jgi:hypothetical protein
MLLLLSACHDNINNWKTVSYCENLLGFARPPQQVAQQSSHLQPRQLLLQLTAASVAAAAATNIQQGMQQLRQRSYAIGFQLLRHAAVNVWQNCQAVVVRPTGLYQQHSSSGRG